MSDDIFSQLFNLFNNNDEEINWKLAEQISNHINKDFNEVNILSNGQLSYEEIFRVAQANINTGFNTTDDIANTQLLDSKSYGIWFLNSIRHFNFSDMSISGTNSFNLGGAQSSLIGMQLGNIAGFLSKNTWGLSHFGIILPNSKKLALNKSNFEERISLFDIDEKESTLALLSLEYIALSLGKYDAPFAHIVQQMKKSNQELIENFNDLSQDIDPSSLNNPNEIFGNLPEINNLNFDSIFDAIFAPLSFYRNAIKHFAKNFIEFIDPSVFDLVMDLSFKTSRAEINDFELKISNFDQYSMGFIDYLADTDNQFGILDILNSIELIPSSKELEDPISWAARTSLPPI